MEKNLDVCCKSLARDKPELTWLKKTSATAELFSSACQGEGGSMAGMQSPSLTSALELWDVEQETGLRIAQNILLLVVFCLFVSGVFFANLT